MAEPVENDEKLEPFYEPTDEGLPVPIKELHPTLPEIMNNQATINIGTIGHVAHGKTTLVKAISGVFTIKFSEEKKNNRTIKLGYANAKIFKCDNPLCPAPLCYKSGKCNEKEGSMCLREDCGGIMRLVRHVSFVDCPGHDDLMATMLNGAAVMDAAILLIAGNETCPQPQTREHLAAIEIMQLKNILIVQNKIDLIKKTDAVQQYKEIKEFVKGSTAAADAPIIPVSAQLKINTDLVAQHIVTHIPIPVRDYLSAPRLIVVRSFDVNKPGSRIDQLVGGIAGGSLACGVLKIGMEVELRPGYIEQNSTKKTQVLRAKVVSLKTEENVLEFAVPGGLIGVGTDLDPFLCKNNNLVGQILGVPGYLPEVYTAIEIKFNLLYNLVGVKTRDDSVVKVDEIQKDEILKVNIGSHTIAGTVYGIKGLQCKISLVTPVCAKREERIALSRRIQNTWRLIGYGTLLRGKKIKND